MSYVTESYRQQIDGSTITIPFTPFSVDQDGVVTFSMDPGSTVTVLADIPLHRAVTASTGYELTDVTIGYEVDNAALSSATPTVVVKTYVAGSSTTVTPLTTTNTGFILTGAGAGTAAISSPTYSSASAVTKYAIQFVLTNSDPIEASTITIFYIDAGYNFTHL